MKKLIAVGIALTVSASAFAALTAEQKKNMTPEEKAARRAAAMKRMYERTGGFIIAPNKDGRVLAIINGQKSVDAAYFDEIAASIKSGLQFPVVICDKRPDNAGVVIEVKENDYPSTFITAPESGYAMVNITQLKKDNPDENKLKTRLMKETWRTLVYLLGGGNDPQPVCLMKPVASLDDLDALQSTCPCPMTFGAVSETAKRFGVVPERRISYRNAVMEGWAPQPTNDVQKVIWEEVHAKPTKPMKVKYDPKKGE